jgi:hypothetical protein
MVNDGITKRTFGTSAEGKRGIGKPKQRWEYCGLGYQSHRREEFEEPGTKERSVDPQANNDKDNH